MVQSRLFFLQHELNVSNQNSTEELEGLGQTSVALVHIKGIGSPIGTSTPGQAGIQQRRENVLYDIQKDSLKNLT